MMHTKRHHTHTSIARPYRPIWIGLGMCWTMINDDEDILKYFIAFNIVSILKKKNIASYGPIFRAVVVSKIVAHLTIPLS